MITTYLFLYRHLPTLAEDPNAAEVVKISTGVSNLSLIP